MNLFWLPLAVVAYAIFSVNNVVDKLVVTNKLKNPLTVSFWVSLYGIPSAAILLVGLLPFPWADAFRFQAPSLDALMLITAAGLSLQLALLLSYLAFMHGEATRVVPTIGAATPAFTFGFAWVILGERLPPLGLVAFILLLAGAVVVAWRRGHTVGWWFWLALASGGASALQTVLLKAIYGYNQFISALALTGLGNIIMCAVLLLLVPAARHELTSLWHHPKTRARPKRRLKRLLNAGPVWILANGLLGSLGVIVFNLSIKLGPVSLVSALRGIQYIGVLIIAILLSRALPKLLHEELSAGTIRQKLLAIALIGLGVGLLVVSA